MYLSQSEWHCLGVFIPKCFLPHSFEVNGIDKDHFSLGIHRARLKDISDNSFNNEKEKRTNVYNVSVCSTSYLVITALNGGYRIHGDKGVGQGHWFFQL